MTAAAPPAAPHRLSVSRVIHRSGTLLTLISQLMRLSYEITADTDSIPCASNAPRFLTEHAAARNEPLDLSGIVGVQ